MEYKKIGDKTIICSDCGMEFIFAFQHPKRCGVCSRFRLLEYKPIEA